MTDKLVFQDLTCRLVDEDNLSTFQLANGRYLYDYEFAMTHSLHRTDNLRCVGDVSYAGGHGIGIIRGCGTTFVSDEGKGIGGWLAIYGAGELAKRGVKTITIDSLDRKAGEFWMHMANNDMFPYTFRLRTSEDDKLPRTGVPTSGPHLIGVLKKISL